MWLCNKNSSIKFKSVCFHLDTEQQRHNVNLFDFEFESLAERIRLGGAAREKERKKKEGNEELHDKRRVDLSAAKSLFSEPRTTDYTDVAYQTHSSGI